jgi:replicative DNA helicase
MLDREAFGSVCDILRPESFYTDAHQHIYRAVHEISASGDPVDLLTVTERLKASGNLDKVGGGYYLVELSNRVASAANIEYHARIIAQKAAQRNLISVCTETLRKAYEDTVDVFELLDQFQTAAFSVQGEIAAETSEIPVSMSQSLMAALAEIERAQKGETGYTTGLASVDRESGGYFKGEMTCIAARPGVGKTEYALGGAIENAKLGHKVWFVSLEMTGPQLVKRLLSKASGVTVGEMRRGTLTDGGWASLQSAGEGLMSLPISFCGFKTPQRLYAAVRKAVAKGNLDILFVDYLQLMEVDGGGRNQNREQEVSNISRTLKRISRDFQIPVIALSQLNRAVESRASKQPELHDLRESGAVEQDCDVVKFLYRPEMHEIFEMSFEGENVSTKGKCFVYSRKNRHDGQFRCLVGFENGHFCENAEATQFPVSDFNPSAVPAKPRDQSEDIPF